MSAVSIKGRQLHFKAKQRILPSVAKHCVFDAGFQLLVVEVPSIVTLVVSMMKAGKPKKVFMFPPEKSPDQAVEASINILLEKGLNAWKKRPRRKRRTK